MEIEIGDTVQIKDKPVFSGLTVLSIEGDNVICSYYTLDKPLDGTERPETLIIKQGVFPLEKLVNN